MRRRRERGCYSARGPDADRHAKLLIHLAVEGLLFGAYSQTAILSVGGYLGVGDRLVQVRLDTIRFPKDASAPSLYPQKAVIATSKETLAGMPPFKY